MNEPRPGITELRVISDLAETDFDCPGCNAVTGYVEVFPPLVHVQTWHERDCAWLREQANR